MAPRILLVHPPIHDFAAFDLFVYPLSLVEVGQRLADAGCSVTLVDALDRFIEAKPAPGEKGPTFRADGCGHFRRVPRPPPAPIEGIPRIWHRFGLSGPELDARLADRGRPDAVVVTCAMTYWYPGVVEIADRVRRLWPGVPMILGGTYATLCSDHARRHVEPDLLVEGPDPKPLMTFLAERLGVPGKDDEAIDPDRGPSDGHALVTGDRVSAAVRSTRGCPRRCPYCASPRLGGLFRRRSPEAVTDELEYLVRDLGRSAIAFYDDALLDGPGEPFLELAEAIRSRGLHEQARFHCPNALRAAAISPNTARALAETRFRTIRIGFETADPELQRDLGAKATNDQLASAVERLRSAGYAPTDLGVYLLVGLPGQSPESVAESIRFVHRIGAPCRLADFSPVPGTPIFEEARARSVLDLDEPLNHNKTLSPYRFPGFTPEDLAGLKNLCRDGNRAFGA